jgi:hypothetical protein
MQSINQPETEHRTPRRSAPPSPGTVRKVIFDCPLDLKIQLDTRKAVEQSTVQAICIAALKQYLGVAA